MSKKIKILFDPADRERLEPILAALRDGGVGVSELGGEPAKDEIVLAALSEHFYANAEAEEKLLSLIGSGAENVLPLQLDELPIPETLKSALYSRNIIPAAGREPAQIAERITAAMPQKKSGLPRLLVIAAAVLIVLGGLLIWNGRKGEETVPVAAEPEMTINIPAGLTMEDLEKIAVVSIVGDRTEFYTSEQIGKMGRQPEWDELANRNFDENGAHYYSREDGHEYQMTRYEDLRFLGLMPKLHTINLALVDAGELPDLSGCTQLQNVGLRDCVIPDLEWLAGTNVNYVDILNSTGSIRDFSPLTRCEKLSRAHIDLVRTREADLSGFGPAKLSWLWINNGEDLRGELDLSGLKNCTRLRECELEWRLPIRDLSFLSGAGNLYRLRLENLNELEDISVLRGMDQLLDLNISDCNRIRDYSPIAGCVGLEDVNISVDQGRGGSLRDASFLAELPALKKIGLHGIQLPGLDFLYSVAERQNIISFEITGAVDDFGGLSAVKRYQRLSLDMDNGRIDNIMPLLEGKSVEVLILRRIGEVDLSTLPHVTSRVELDRCGITDLSTLPEDWSAMNLNLNKCSLLRSLEGIQTMKKFTVGPSLTVYNCPRLSDWSALEGMSLRDLNITGGYSLPDFSTFRVGTLRLESVADVTDLEFLNGMDESNRYSFELVGLDELKSLAPLRRFHGDRLAVSPQLAEQAQDLVNAGNFREFSIEFPEGGWEMDDMEFSLLSLDELETLPKAMLRRVSKLTLVGDTVVDTTNADIWEEWDHNGRTLMLHRWSDDSTTPIRYGAGKLNDFGLFADLTGLRDLQLYEQPLRSLDGVQNFPELENLQIRDCEELEDVSAAFACQNLRWISFDNCEISSIQGVQNLNALRGLNINNTRVSDLSPLTGCDFSAAVAERGGLELFINGLPVEDFSPLASIPLARLDINDIDAERYIRYLDGQPLQRFYACNSFVGRGEADDNALFADFVRSHPDLVEIGIPWNQAITDLTPVLELEHLEQLRVSRDMKEALDSLEGQSYGFRLEIEG